MAMTAVVCLGQFLPSDAGNYAAKVVSLTGQVSVLKDFQPWALSVGDSIQVTQRIVTGPDGHAVLQVSDGSTIEVYPNSTFVFRKNPGNWRDLIDVFLGKVRVHIEHLGTTPNPNRVITPVAVISVRGTTFDVTVNDDDETTTVEVEDGTVEVRHNSAGREYGRGQRGRSFPGVSRMSRSRSGWTRATLARQAMRIVRQRNCDRGPFQRTWENQSAGRRRRRFRG